MKIEELGLPSKIFVMESNSWLMIHETSRHAGRKYYQITVIISGIFKNKVVKII